MERADNYECPEKIYKYLGFEGLKKTLENRSFQLSKPSLFNDPFDTNIEETLPKQTPEFLKDFLPALYDFISTNQNVCTNRYPLLKIIGSHLKALSPEKRKLFREQFLNTPIQEIYNVESLENSNRELIQNFTDQFESDGVFCTTIDKQNLLMWAHYADHHKGAVIEFTPCRESDSVLLASKKVSYSNCRPVLYDSAEEFVHHSFLMSPNESIEILLNRIVFTKSLEWQYEQEYRLCVPYLIKKGEKYSYLEYKAHELTAVFLGCRMTDDNCLQATTLARQINPHVNIYKGSTLSREFGLEFEKIE